MTRSYAFKSCSSDLTNASSGGAFSQIVRNFYKKGAGTVYGAYMDEDLNIRHTKVCTLEQCAIFNKSKYVRSDTSGVNESVLNDLVNDCRVLFSGTPCQVYSLLVFLKKKSVPIDRLITVDIICNGAPDASVWHDYVNWIQALTGNELISFCFREKGDKNNPYLTKAIFKNGLTISDKPITACYNRLFLKKLIIPQGCFKCPFKKEDRLSDITLADFWGADVTFDEVFWHKEVSLVLVNSEKGNKLFNIDLIDNDSKIRECYNKEYLPYQLNLQGISVKPVGYDKFWSEYHNKGFGFVLRKYADVGFPRNLLYPLRRLFRDLKALKKL